MISFPVFYKKLFPAPEHYLAEAAGYGSCKCRKQKFVVSFAIKTGYREILKI